MSSSPPFQDRSSHGHEDGSAARSLPPPRDQALTLVWSPKQEPSHPRQRASPSSHPPPSGIRRVAEVAPDWTPPQLPQREELPTIPMRSSSPSFDDVITARFRRPDSEAWPFQATLQEPEVVAPQPSLTPCAVDVEDEVLRMRIARARILGIYGIAAAFAILSFEMLIIVLS